MLLSRVDSTVVRMMDLETDIGSAVAEALDWKGTGAGFGCKVFHNTFQSNKLLPE